MLKTTPRPRSNTAGCKVDFPSTLFTLSVPLRNRSPLQARVELYGFAITSLTNAVFYDVTVVNLRLGTFALVLGSVLPPFSVVIVNIRVISVSQPSPPSLVALGGRARPLSDPRHLEI